MATAPLGPGPTFTDQQLINLMNDPGLKDSPIKKLPLDAIRLIFINLGVNDIEKARLVCRTFKTLADDKVVLQAVARQLNIPVKTTDEPNVVRKLLIFHEVLKDLYSITQKDGQTVVQIKENYIELHEQAQKKLNNFIRKSPDHPAIKELKKIINSTVKEKYPKDIIRDDILRDALPKLPPGSWIKKQSLDNPTAYFFIHDPNTGEIKVDYSNEPDKIEELSQKFEKDFPNLQVVVEYERGPRL